MCDCVGREKMWNFRKMNLDGMDDTFCVNCRMVCSNLCGWASKGDIHLVTTKDRIGVSSHLTPLSCKPLDR